ncbi:MAG: excinuclease ABC subunit UvrA [Oligoflexales bacterium]|nr:excinuclease ABC subunit UvrA [Oligoflexales bacterium]
MKTMEDDECIELEDVETHNLRKIRALFPLNKLTIVTGVSGSGKSSLVFDTLYAESYRRYVDSLSSYARQFIKSLPKPALSSAKNLPPSIAVRQSRMRAQHRSTVGTLTELHEVLQILFSYLAKIYCSGCGNHIEAYHAKKIAEHLSQGTNKALLLNSRETYVLAPLAFWAKLPSEILSKQLLEQGFSRILHKGQVLKIQDCDPKFLETSQVIIERLRLNEAFKSGEIDKKSPVFKSFLNSIDLAFKVSKGRAQVLLREVNKEQIFSYSAELECLVCKKKFTKPVPSSFSFNHPLGACLSCQGYGRMPELDWQKIIPDRSASIASKGIAPLNFGSHSSYYNDIKKSAALEKIDTKKPFSDFTPKEWQWLKEGTEKGKSKGKKFGGMKDYFEWLFSKKYKAHYRIHAARFQTYVPCSTCQGTRYKPETSQYKIAGKTIAEVEKLSIAELPEWLEGIEKSEASQGQETGLEDAFTELYTRLRYLVKVGLSYLSLNRVSSSLSGGESQRIHMARCLGNALTDTLYCLDEPSCGLHAKDIQNLFEVLNELKNQGNTVVIVEHESLLIQRADHLIEIGPEAGHKGGHIVYEGVPKSLESAQCKKIKKKKIDLGNWDFFHLEGAKTHNLKDVRASIPLGKVTVVCGVSGSGKTSLVQHTLYPLLKKLFEDDDEEEPTEDGGAEGTVSSCCLDGIPLLQSSLSGVHLVDQSGLGRSSRSNIITYLGIFDSIRKLFAKEPRAKELKLSAGSFSFNVDKGRCETCRGLGMLVEDLSFLGEMSVICPDCEGRRFHDDILSVCYRAHNLNQVLALTVEQALTLFFDQPSIRLGLQAAMDLGLGYLTLGQNTSSFSGGEAQRLKTLSLIQKVHLSDKKSNPQKPLLLIFDEPSTGLSAKDISVFLNQLDFLTEKGHTFVLIEHQLDVIRHADWVIELGPGASHAGGQVLYEGTPEGMARSEASVTGPFLVSS